MNRPFSKKHLHSKEPRPFFASFYGNDPAAANEKHPSPHKKRGRLASKRKFKIHPASPFFGNIFFIGILQKTKILVYCIPFPFLPLFMPFSFSSPLHFHISFPKALLFFTVYTELSTLHPPYSRDFAKLSTLSTALCTFSRHLQEAVSEYLSFVYFTAFAVFLPFYAPFLCPSPSFSFTILHRQNQNHRLSRWFVMPL